MLNRKDINLRAIVILTFSVFAVVTQAKAQLSMLNDDSDRIAVIKLIEVEFKEKTAVSGTLDLFHNDKIYNLRLIGFDPQFIEQGEIFVQRGKFRDINTGDILAVDAVVGKTEDGNLAFAEWNFVGITQAAPEPEQKEYSDEEILSYMKDYFEQKSKFTGTFDIYDEKKQVLLNLELGEWRRGLRKFGALSIATVNTTDKKSGGKVNLDITVENKDGRLSVQSVRIK